MTGAIPKKIINDLITGGNDKHTADCKPFSGLSKYLDQSVSLGICN